MTKLPLCKPKMALKSQGAAYNFTSLSVSCKLTSFMDKRDTVVCGNESKDIHLGLVYYEIALFTLVYSTTEAIATLHTK